MTTIAELGIRVDSGDAAHAATDLDKLVEAGGRAEKAAAGVEQSAKKAGQALRGQADDLGQLLGEIDPTVKALGRLDELESRLAKQKKFLDPEIFSEYQGKIHQSREALTRFDDSLTRTGNTAKQNAAALRGVPAQFTDIFVSLQGGQAPLTVLLQQGGQLKDMFGGIAPAAKALGGYVLGLVNPFTVAAAAAGALALAYYKGSQEADEYNKAIIFTGNAAGTSADQLASMAQQVSATVGTTGAAAEVLAKLAGSGKIASGSFEKITEVALSMEKATGRAIDETVAEFAKIAKDPVAAAKELNDQYNFLTASVYSQIVALKEQGDTIGAAKLLTDTYADTIRTRTGEVTENLGLIESAWKGIKSAAAEALDATLSVGRAQTLEQQAEVIRQRLQTNQGRGGRAAAMGIETRDTENDQKQLAFLEMQIEAEKNRVKFVGEYRESQRKSILAQDTLNGQLKASDSNAVKLKARLVEIDKLAKDSASGNGGRVYTEAELNQLREAAKKQFADKPVSGGSVNLTGFNDSRNSLAAILAEYKNAEKELNAAQKAGIISQESYAAQRAAIIEQQKDEVTNAYQAEIAALEAAKGKAGTSAAQRVQLDQKIADARANMVKAQKDADSELAVLATNEEGRLKRQEAATQAYIDQLERQRAALSTSGTRGANALGLGDRQAGLQRDLDGVTDRFNDERAKLLDRRRTAPDKYSQNDYERDLAILGKAEDKYRDTVVDNYAKISDAQGNWRSGASSAFQNYLESARDVAGQTKSLFSSAFMSMEDAVVNFAMTGKLSFADFAKSILADMARIAVRQASSSALSGLFGLVSTAASAYLGGGNGMAAGSAGAISSNLGASQAGYSSAYGFDAGGYTGDGGKYEPAGIVHKGEVVIRKEVVQQPGMRRYLELINKRGYADGGYVGSSGSQGVAGEGRATPTQIIVNVDARDDGGSGVDPARLAEAIKTVCRQEIATARRNGGQLT